MEDMIQRLKAAYMVEEPVDLICRLTADLSEVISLFGALDKFPLLGSTVDVSVSFRFFDRVQITKGFFMEQQLAEQDKTFLKAAITGCLMAQGNCVILGADPDYVSKVGD